MTRNTSLNLLNLIAQAIYDKKGMNILALDVRGISSMTDYYIIAEGSVDRHVRAISLSVTDALKQVGHSPFHVEGQRDGDWVVVDYGDIVIHLFVPDIREKYALEELWSEAKIVDLEIVVKKDEPAAKLR